MFGQVFLQRKQYAMNDTTLDLQARYYVKFSGGTAYWQPSTLLKNPQYTELQPGLIYVMRRINGTDVPLLIENQRSYREWIGCFSAIR